MVWDDDMLKMFVEYSMVFMEKQFVLFVGKVGSCCVVSVKLVLFEIGVVVKVLVKIVCVKVGFVKVGFVKVSVVKFGVVKVSVNFGVLKLECVVVKLVVGRIVKVKVVFVDVDVVLMVFVVLKFVDFKFVVVKVKLLKFGKVLICSVFGCVRIVVWQDMCIVIYCCCCNSVEDQEFVVVLQIEMVEGVVDSGLQFCDIMFLKVFMEVVFGL